MNNCLGKYVKERRQDMGLSLREFADRCGISHTHVDSIEKGFDVRSGRQVNLTSMTIRKLSKALGVKETELISMNLGKEVGNTLTKDEQLKLALFGSIDVPDEMLEEVKEYAQFILTHKKR